MISPAAASIYDIADKGARLSDRMPKPALRPLMPQISGLDALRDDGRFRFFSLRMYADHIVMDYTPLYCLLTFQQDMLFHSGCSSRKPVKSR